MSELGFATVARWPAPEGVTGVTDFLRRGWSIPSGWLPTAVPNWKLFAATQYRLAPARVQQCELF